MVFYDVFVFIIGEFGIGKELVVWLLYYNSLWWNKFFVVENCGVFFDEFLESEMFGYKCGVFIGVVEDYVGFFEWVNGGIIFFDEIGEVFLVF